MRPNSTGWNVQTDRLILGRLKIRLRIDNFVFWLLKNDIQHYNLYFSLEIDPNITSIIDFISISITPNGRISKSHITRWLHVTKTHVTNGVHVTVRLSPSELNGYITSISYFGHKTTKKCWKMFASNFSARFFVWPL